jgi:hypothetical protein
VDDRQYIISANPRPRGCTTYKELSTSDSIVDDRISAERCQNVAELFSKCAARSGNSPTVVDETEKWAKVIKFAGIKPE